MKIKYPIRLWLSVVGMAAPDERNAAELAKQRADSVKTLTDILGISKVNASEAKSYVNSPSEMGMTSDGGTVAVIDLNPGCPNDCCDALPTASTKK